MIAQGNEAHNRGDFAAARDDFQRARDASIQTGHPDLEIYALNGLGIVFLSEGHFEEAHDVFDRALKLADESVNMNGHPGSVNVHDAVRDTAAVPSATAPSAAGPSAPSPFATPPGTRSAAAPSVSPSAASSGAPLISVIEMIEFTLAHAKVLLHSGYDIAALDWCNRAHLLCETLRIQADTLYVDKETATALTNVGIMIDDVLSILIELLRSKSGAE